MEQLIDVCDGLNGMNMNEVVSGTETDLSLTSATCLLSSEANTVVSIPEEIYSSGDKINGCIALSDICHPPCGGNDDVMCADELKSILLDNSSGVGLFADHSIVPSSSFCVTGDLLDSSDASVMSSATAVDANNILDVSMSVPESSHEALRAEGHSSVQQLFSSSQEASSLSFCNTDIEKSSSVATVDHNVKQAVSPAELYELPPEEVRWLYRDRGSRQKKWLPFIGYDSLRIECKFRETRARAVRNGLNCSSSADELVVVRGGLYEVDVIQKTCIPIYWTAEGVVYDYMVVQLDCVLK